MGVRRCPSRKVAREERAEIRDLEDDLEALREQLQDIDDLLDHHGIPERRTFAQRLGLLEGRLTCTAALRGSEPA